MHILTTRQIQPSTQKDMQFPQAHRHPRDGRPLYAEMPWAWTDPGSTGKHTFMSHRTHPHRHQKVATKSHPHIQRSWAVNVTGNVPELSLFYYFMIKTFRGELCGRHLFLGGRPFSARNTQGQLTAFVA